jgi:hypothetical protein
LWLDLVDLNGPKINEMIMVLVNNNIPVDPTLDIYEAHNKRRTSEPVSLA